MISKKGMGMVDLADLTQRYVEAFNSRDLDVIATMLHDEFTLTDPSVRGVGPKEKALEVIQGLFEMAGNSLSFSARNIYVSGSTSFIEFDLELNGDELEGTDIIEWQGDKLIEMRAYVNSKP